MSKEHVISDWVRRSVNETYNEHVFSQILIKKHEDQAVIIPRLQFHDAGIGNRKRRQVCKSCNNGWLSDIQDVAIPYLGPLLHGNWDRVGFAWANAISAWFTMTVMNIDGTVIGGGGISSNERRIFSQTHVPPSHWSIWIGKASGSDPYEIYHRPFGAYTKSEIPPLEGNRKNCQITTLKVGQVVLHATSFPTSVISFDIVKYGVGLGLIPLHPIWLGDNLDWRMAPFQFEDNIQNIANSFHRKLLGQALR